MKHLLAVALGCVLILGCKSSEEGKESEKEASKAPTASTGLMMKSDSEACKKAMECCEAHVKADKGELTPENVNLGCSGVAMAKTDEECNQFKKGYAATFKDGEELPEACK